MAERSRRSAADTTSRPMSARNRDVFAAHQSQSGNAHGIVSEEKRQLSVITSELRKELIRMDLDEWRYPVTHF